MTGPNAGDEYTLDHLDAMIDAFDKVGFEPVVKAGHADGQEDAKEARKVCGAPSLGNVERIYRRGDVLLADLTNIPRKFADLIRAGAYRRISSEIYFNYIGRAGRKVSRVLKAIAFLGADILAITDLKAIESLYPAERTFR